MGHSFKYFLYNRRKAQTNENTEKQKHTHPRVARTASPGATISGLMRLSVEGPYELKNETVSMSAELSPAAISPPSALVPVNDVSPEDDDPTASTFLPMAGLPIVHEVLDSSPSLPAANSNRWSGFLEKR